MAQARPDHDLRAAADGRGRDRAARVGRDRPAGDRARGRRRRVRDASPFPPPESLYDDVYVLGDQVKGWYSVDARSAGIHRGEHERDLDEAERGPRGAYAAAVAQASEEDLGLERASDEAQSEDDLAEHP